MTTGGLGEAQTRRVDEVDPLAIAATALGFVLVQFDVSIVIVARPTMERELHSSVADLQWLARFTI